MIKRLLVAAAILVSFAARAACPGASGSPPDPSSVLTVKMSTLDVLQEEERRNVASLGTIKNESGSCFEEVVVEVRYFDRSHALSDTVTQSLYGLVVPAHGEVAIRVVDGAAKPKDAYVSQEARVVFAEPRRPVQKARPTLWSTVGEILVSWGPMVLLMAMWAFFMRRMRGKDSPQERSIALMQQQVEASAALGQSLQRVAAALESMASTRRES